MMMCEVLKERPLGVMTDEARHPAKKLSEEFE
jgi:hypothetical protein